MTFLYHFKRNALGNCTLTLALTIVRWWHRLPSLVFSKCSCFLRAYQLQSISTCLPHRGTTRVLMRMIAPSFSIHPVHVVWHWNNSRFPPHVVPQVVQSQTTLPHHDDGFPDHGIPGEQWTSAWIFHFRERQWGACN